MSDVVERLRSIAESLRRGKWLTKGEAETITEAADEIERLREALARIAQIDSDGLESHTPQAMVNIARKALVDVDSDPPCTDCNDTGFNPNTERQCTCDAALKGNQ